MKRMITKKMRDSFNVAFNCRVDEFYGVDSIGGRWKAIYNYFESTKKQRLLILRRTIK